MIKKSEKKNLTGYWHEAKEKLCARRLAAQLQRLKQAILKRMEEMEKKIMSTQAELVVQIKALTAQSKKTQGEIKLVQASVTAGLTKIDELIALIAAGGQITPELTDAADELKVTLQETDDLIPDPVVVPDPGV